MHFQTGGKQEQKTQRKWDTPNLTNVPKITQVIISRSETWTSAIWLQMRAHPLDGKLILEQGGRGGKGSQQGWAKLCPVPSFYQPEKCHVPLYWEEVIEGTKGGRSVTQIHTPPYGNTTLSSEIAPESQHLFSHETSASMCTQAWREATSSFVDSSWKKGCISFLASLFNHAWLCQVLLDNLR